MARAKRHHFCGISLTRIRSIVSNEKLRHSSSDCDVGDGVPNSATCAEISLIVVSVLNAFMPSDTLNARSSPVSSTAASGGDSTNRRNLWRLDRRRIPTLARARVSPWSFSGLLTSAPGAGPCNDAGDGDGAGAAELSNDEIGMSSLPRLKVSFLLTAGGAGTMGSAPSGVRSRFGDSPEAGFSCVGETISTLLPLEKNSEGEAPAHSYMGCGSVSSGHLGGPSAGLLKETLRCVSCSQADDAHSKILHQAPACVQVPSLCNAVTC